MQKICLPLLSIFLAANVLAQQNDTLASPKLPSVLASVDAYYRYNFNSPPGTFNNYTRFTNSQNSFELGMASVTVSHSYKKVSALIDLGFGRRAEELNYTEGDHPSLFSVKQAYVSYRPAERWNLTFGKFFANTGYERVDAYQNDQYSTSYLFSYGPLFFTGLKAEVRLKGKTYFMAGLANPADFTSTTSPVKTLIASLRTSDASGRLGVELNYLGYSGLSTPRLLVPGYLLYREQNQVNLTVRDSVSRKFRFGLTGRLQSADNGDVRTYGGGAVFLTYMPAQTTGLHLRAEYLVDNYALKIGGKIFESTLSADFKIDRHLRFLPELRYDRGSVKIFQGNDYLGRNYTLSALAAAVYVF